MFLIENSIILQTWFWKEELIEQPVRIWGHKIQLSTLNIRCGKRREELTSDIEYGKHEE